jgi:hypothetical protein
MTPTLARNVRIGFAGFALALTAFAGLENLAGTARAGTIQACGTAESPCSLAPLIVTAEPAAPRQLGGGSHAGRLRDVAETVSVQDAAMHRVSGVRKS